MKSLSLALLFNLTIISVLSSQCILPSGSYSWGLSELNSHITSNCGGDLSAGLIIPTDAVITIQNNDAWDLTVYGSVPFTILGNGSLEFNGTDELTLSLGSSLVIENSSNTIALKESGVGTNIRISIGATTFTGDQFAVIIASGGANQDGLLPIELLSFSSTVNQQFQVELNWETLTESNNSHFDIEYSSDGFNFENIGTVAGAGNSIHYRTYDFLHTSPNKGINYYRLKQVDYDGNFEYVETIVQEISTSVFFELKYQTYSALSFDIKQSAKLEIFNLAGKTVATFSLRAGEHVINLSELQSGQYIIRIHKKGAQKIIRIVR